MVGKNNSYLRESKSNDHFKRFSLRKLNIGVVSVAIAAGFYFGNGATAQAATTETSTAIKTEQVEQQDSNTIVASTAPASNSSSANAVVLKSRTAPTSVDSSASVPVSESADASSDNNSSEPAFVSAASDSKAITASVSADSDQPISGSVTVASAPVSETADASNDNNSSEPAFASAASDSKAITASASADSGQPISDSVTVKTSELLSAALAGQPISDLVTVATESNNDQKTQSNVDLSLWKWQTADSTKGYNGIELTGYTGAVGDTATIYVPNSADFIKAGKIKVGQSVYLGDLLNIKNCQRLIIDDHDGGKVVFDSNPFFISQTLEYIDVSGADTHLLTDMDEMFSDSPNLKQIVGLEKFDTSHAQDFTFMFANDPQLMDIGDLSKWDVSQVKTFNSMFMFDKNLANIGNLDNWDVSQATDFTQMFTGTKKLESIGSLKNWQVKNVMSMHGMFAFSSIAGVDMSNWDVSSLKNATWMFAYNFNPRLTNLELPNFSKAKLGSWLYAFVDDNYLENLNISGWDFADDLMPSYDEDGNVTYVHFNKYFHDVIKKEKGIDANLFDKWLSTSGMNGLTVNTIGAKWPSDLDLMPKNSDFDYNPKYGLTDNIVDITPLGGEYLKDIKYSEKPTPLVVLTDNQTLLGYNKQRSESNRPNEITLVDKNGKVVGQYQMPIFYTSVDGIKEQIAQYEEEFTQNYRKQNNDPKATFTFTLVDSETHQELTEKQIENLTPAQLVMTTYLVRQNAKAYVEYVDNQTGKVLQSDEIDGHVGEPIQYSTEKTIKKFEGQGYKLSNDGFPKTIENYDADDNADQTFKVVFIHAVTTVTPDNPKTPADVLPDNPGKNYPSGVAKDDLNKTVTRTINVHNLDGTITPIVQTAHLTRTAVVDEVTFEVTYSDWTTGSWDKFTSTPIAGYTASLTELPAVKVYATTNDDVRDVIYTANNQSMRINYVSDDGDNIGEVIDFTPVNGHTDETVETNGKVPAGWKLADGQSIPAKITFKGVKTDDVPVKVKHAHVTVLPDNPKTTADKLPDNKNKNYPTGVAYTDLNKTITRTIEIDEPNGNIIFVPKQEVHYTRTADVDEVTGDVTYGDWTTTDEFAEFDGVPVIPGYAPSQSKVDAMTPKVDDHDSTVKITYTANEQSMHIIYVDEEGNTVKTDPVSGHTDETVKTNSTVPAGWKLADGQQPAPERITFKGAKTDDQTIKVKPAHVIVTADKPKTTVDKLPDNPTKNYPNGVAENDLNKTVKRTIYVHNTDGTKTTVTQSVHFTRNADVDEAHGTVEYSEWKADKQFEQYIIPTVPGYVSVVDGKEQTMIQPAMPSISDHNSTIEVNYQAVDGSQTIDYVDKNDTVVSYQIITGKTSEEKTVKSAVPTGWKLVNGQQVPTTVTIKAKDVPIEIRIEHDHVQVSHDAPQVDGTKIPGGATDFHGVAKSDLNKTITRTITVVDPHKGAQTVTQPATIHRDATVDKVDGSVVYGDWTTAEWPAYKVPAVAGYTPSQATVGAQTVTNETKDTPVTVTYTANAQMMHVKYVDAQGNVVKSDPVSGHTDETVKTNSTVPAGWKLMEGQSVPAAIKFSANMPDVTVKVEHAYVTVLPDNPKTPANVLPDNPGKNYPSGVAKDDLNKTVTRTINITTPDGKTQTTTQKAEFTRSATVDEVTGEVTYGPWSKNVVLESVDVPNIPGYVPSASVPEITVMPNDQDMTINITYKKLDSGKATDQGGNASNGGQATNGGSTTGQSAQNGQAGQTQNNAGAQQLPQTGNANNEKGVLGLAGAMIAAGLGLGFGSKKKRHED